MEGWLNIYFLYSGYNQIWLNLPRHDHLWPGFLQLPMDDGQFGVIKKILKLHESHVWDLFDLGWCFHSLGEIGKRAQNAIWNFRAPRDHKHLHNKLFFFVVFFSQPCGHKHLHNKFYFLSIFFSQPLNYCDNH
jgi:hypothetical protein